ncbi:MAG: hypothetical protein K0M63_04870 [Weeksellaceae bacterium]|nr:hypothetical protein [Weeksellaceae bacterium]
MINSIKNAQNDMRTGYGYGSVGVFTSGLVWLASALAVDRYGSNTGMWTLIIGGMMIFPLSTLIGKLVGVTGKHDKSNPLAKAAMEGTVWMIMCIPLAYGVSMVQPEWFFQSMLLIIGGRYLTFASLYGLRMYWILGCLLGLAAYILFALQADAFISALAGGVIELVFGIMLYVYFKKRAVTDFSETAG